MTEDTGLTNYNTQTKLEFGAEALMKLQPIKSRLESLELYQATEVEETVKHLVDDEDLAIKKWAEGIIDAAYAENQLYYDELLALIRESS